MRPELVLTREISPSVETALDRDYTVHRIAGRADVGGVPEALVIGASGWTDEREPYSNFGACVDVFAPGGNIMSAYNWDDSAAGTMSGTSMATPHVAGAAALSVLPASVRAA